MRRLPTPPRPRLATSPILRAGAAAVALASLTSCNDYDMFRRAGYQQESFSNRADLLFIMDNTDTMKDASAGLAAHFQAFIDRLQAQEEEIARESLSDAVDNYKGYVQDRKAFLDYQIAITTIDVQKDRGHLQGVPGRTLLKREDPDLHRAFVENLLCEATCFRPGAVPSDPGYTCGDPLEGEITTQYLDCVCGEGTWADANCATTGREEGLETVLMSLCAAVPNPPLDCFAPTTDALDPDQGELAPLFTDADRLVNEGLVRPRSTFIPIIISDEGDDSRRELLGDPLAKEYERIFASFDTRVSWVIIGPPLNDDLSRPVECVGYPDWSAARYDYMVRTSDGLKIPIIAPDGAGGCPFTDFRDNLEQLGDLLANLLTTFKLQSVPDPDSLLVFVEGEEVPPADIEAVDAFGLPVYASGYTYEPDTNSVRFHGAAIPPNDADVQVYYAPADGMPRSLPF